jgi:hypothetical protein
MNLIFGQSSHQGSSDTAVARIKAFILEHHGGVPDFVHPPTAGFLAGDLRNNGKMVGRAYEDSSTLLFAGFFWGPLPSWTAGSPLDDPDVTALWLLRRYRTLGTAFLDGLSGHYGIAVLDSGTGTVHLAADPYGQRTLYVSTANGRLAFSSNLSTLGQLLGEDLLVDRGWEDFFLIYGFYPDDRTPFVGASALHAGQFLSWRNGRVSTRTITSAKATLPDNFVEATRERSLDTAVDLLYDSFMQALEEQTASAREAGVLLGGFDSALVAAGLQRLGKKVSTWSFHYDDARYNQPYTEDIAAFLGTRHEWVHITEQTLRAGLDRFAYLFNQPTNWPNYVIQTAVVCERMREAGLDFAYSGDGCDTVFLGYPGTWRRARVLQQVPSMPQWLSEALAAILARPLIERHVGHPWRVMLNLIRTASWSPHARGYLSFRILDEVSLRQLRSGSDPVQESELRDAAEALARPYAGLPSLRLAYLGKSCVSPNRNKMSGSSDLSGLPILSPYMHPGFKLLAQSLPEEFCRPQESTASKITGKYILMKMAEDKRLLPSEVIFQKKMAAVDAPVDAWYAGPMRGFMLDKMASLPFAASERYLESLLDPHLAEQLFQKYLLTDKVIKHAPSLLATYACFCGLASDKRRESR